MVRGFTLQSFSDGGIFLGSKAFLMTTKVIFVSGGVISGIGKGVATSSIAILLKSRGFHVTAVKADPY